MKYCMGSGEAQFLIGRILSEFTFPRRTDRKPGYKRVYLLKIASLGTEKKFSHFHYLLASMLFVISLSRVWCSESIIYFSSASCVKRSGSVRSSTTTGT